MKGIMIEATTFTGKKKIGSSLNTDEMIGELVLCAAMGILKIKSLGSETIAKIPSVAIMLS